MSSSNLFDGDPSLLLLDEEDDGTAEVPMWPPLTGEDPSDAPDPVALPSRRGGLSVRAPRAEPVRGPGRGASLRIGQPASRPPGLAGLVDRVRAGAVKGREAARETPRGEASVFDSGYASAPAPEPAPAPRRPAPRAPAPVDELPTGPEIVERDGAAGAPAPRGDRYERATGDVLDPGTTVFDHGYGRPATAPPATERSAGPLQIFVGRPGAEDGGERRAMPSSARGPVWDASALADGEVIWDEGWGGTDDPIDAIPADEEEVISAFEAHEDSLDLEMEAMGEAETTAAEGWGLDLHRDDGALLEALSDDDEVLEAAPDFDDDRAPSAEPFLPVEHTDTADPKPLFPDPAPSSGRTPWWMAADEAAESADPPGSRTDEHHAAVPELEVFRPRLADELAQPLPEEPAPPSGQRRAPWEDPDPWTTGSFRRVDSQSMPAVDAMPRSLDTLSSRRSRVARPATSVPELDPLARDRAQSSLPTRLVLGALFVVAVVAVLVQVARMQQPGMRLGELAPGLTDVAGGAASPTGALVVPGPAPVAPPTEAEALPPAPPAEVAPEAPAPAPAAAKPAPEPVKPLIEPPPPVELGLVRVLAPKGMRIRIDGRTVGRAPIEPQRLKVGSHEIRVGNSRMKVSVTPGRLATVDFTR